MLEQYGFTAFVDFLDHVFSWLLNNNIVTGLPIKVSQYAPILQGYLSNVYFFFPKDILLFFAELTLSFILIRIILAVVNLAWW